MCPRVWEFAGGGEESIPEDAASAYAPQSVPRTRALNPGSRPAPAPCLHPAPSESVHPSRVDGQGLISAPRFETRGAGARAARGARLPRVWGRRGRRPEGARRGGGAAGPRRFPGRGGAGRGGAGAGAGAGGAGRPEKRPSAAPHRAARAPRPLRSPRHSHALWPFGAARGRGAPLQWGFRGPAPGPGARPGRGSRPLLRGGGRPGGPGPAAALCG